jgi:hypothetical protein
VMDRFNEAEMLARYPMAAPKVGLLGSVAGVRHTEIPDPFHYGDLAAVRRCCQIVDECVRALPEQLGWLLPSDEGSPVAVTRGPAASE